jgi:uncharacterized protein with von Willebrand factor type A (vWA) domain
MSADTLFSLDALFERLREAGLNMGLDARMTAHRALAAGFGLESREALLGLICMLWASNADERRVLKHHFDLYFPADWKAAEPPSSPEPGDSDTSGASDESPDDASQIAGGEGAAVGSGVRASAGEIRAGDGGSTPGAPGGGPAADLEPTGAPGSGEPISGPLQFESNIGLLHRDEIEGQATLRRRLAAGREVSGGFILGGEYLPVAERQMKQNWRFLRRPQREGPPVELDVEATVRRVANEGSFFEPVLQPRRVNRAELILLFDQSDSMVPFNPLTRRLAATARAGSSLRSVQTYTFNNVIGQYLYPGETRVDGCSLEELALSWHREHTAIVIFSDAGAARGGFNRRRVLSTHFFLERLGRATNRIVWLNPMPRQRWKGTTAAAISLLAPMFPADAAGMPAAIRVLRGRSRAAEASALT